jgi:hypothetical protein
MPVRLPAAHGDDARRRGRRTFVHWQRQPVWVDVHSLPGARSTLLPIWPLAAGALFPHPSDFRGVAIQVQQILDECARDLVRLPNGFTQPVRQSDGEGGGPAELLELGNWRQELAYDWRERYPQRRALAAGARTPCPDAERTVTVDRNTAQPGHEPPALSILGGSMAPALELSVNHEGRVLRRRPTRPCAVRAGDGKLGHNGVEMQACFAKLGPREAADGEPSPECGYLTDLEAARPYRRDLHIVVETARRVLAASCIARLDPTTGLAAIEPQGVRPENRRRGLAGALYTHAPQLIYAAGGREIVVHPRGDGGYQAPLGAYVRCGLCKVGRTQLYARS